MKNFGKIFVLCFFFSIITTIFVSCGPNLDASIYRAPNGETITDNTQNETTVDQQDELPDPINTAVTPNDEPELPDNKEPETNDEEPNGNEPTETKSECEHDFEYFIVENPTCTKPGYSVPKCKTCGFTDENNKTTIPATGHHEFDEHTHQCKHCQEFEPPINNLAGSYWYLNEKVTIYFETCTPIEDGYHGNYCTFYGSLSDDDYFIKSTTPGKIKNNYSGEYDLTSITDPDTGITQYSIYLYCNNAEPYLFNLEYKVTINENTEKPSYTIRCTDKYLFFSGYNNCTLIFAGYEL